MVTEHFLAARNRHILAVVARKAETALQPKAAAISPENASSYRLLMAIEEQTGDGALQLGISAYETIARKGRRLSNRFT